MGSASEDQRFYQKTGSDLKQRRIRKTQGKTSGSGKIQHRSTDRLHYGPAIIGKEAEVRHCAFIRGNAIVGEGAVVGNSTELKNVVLFNKVQVPHYNYVGDSILGYKAHMGAGSITSNVKSDKKLVVVKDDKGNRIETGLKKFGAMIGDNVEVGCGSILNPGTVVGPDSNIYPLSSVREVIPAHSIYKKRGEVAEKRKQNEK